MSIVIKDSFATFYPESYLSHIIVDGKIKMVWKIVKHFKSKFRLAIRPSYIYHNR